MESHVIALAIVLFYACATYAHPPNSRREDFKQLVSLLGKLKHIDSSQLAHQTSGDIVMELQNSVDPKAGVDKDTLSKALLNRYGMMVKRQGEWSYDYGLGGGRFGKRNYGDYGIGGGRFGRDVDHVDLSDANDPDLLS